MMPHPVAAAIGDTGETVVDAILALAGRQPAAPALHVPGRTSVSFADLATQFSHVRERFEAWGIARGDIVVGVISDRPALALALALIPGVATFAPLASSFPADEYRRLFERMRAKAIVLPRGVEHPARAAARMLDIAEIDIAAEPAGPGGLFALELARPAASLALDATTRPEIAWVLTSSGTTGRPKLIPAEHRAMLLRAAAIGECLQLAPRDIGCHVMPLYLGNGLRTQLMTPLLAGASVVCLPEKSVEALFSALDEYPVTFFAAGFSFLREILRRAPEFRDVLARTQLRFLRASQGRLDAQEIDQLEMAFRAPLLSAYSSTEAGDITHDPLPPRPRKRDAVGVPQSSEVAVMGNGGQLLPPGTTGEIVVRGPAVFRGYLDDPAMTEASFAGEWLRTGDLGYVDEDGYLSLAGRIKEVINRGGEKISPVEIDLAIQNLPAVSEAATFAVPHPTLGEEVVAAVVLRRGNTIDESQVIDHVRRCLGPRKVPRRIYFVDQLPHTDSGKIRRAAIAEMLGLDEAAKAQAARPEAGANAYATPLEAAIAGLWASFLKISVVGRNDDFFLLGGDSLRGTQLLSHINTVFGVNLSVPALFEGASTVAGMAAEIDGIRRAIDTTATSGDASTVSPVAIARQPRATGEPVALSHTQRRAWFLARLDPDSTAYSQVRTYRLRGAIDIEALRSSLQDVIARHEILRTTYRVVDGEPYQATHDDLPLELTFLDLGAIAANTREESLRVSIEAHAAQRFDLDRGPLARFLLIRLSNAEHVFQRVWHHIVSDEWSSGVMERELSQLYRARVRGDRPELPGLPLQYADYALWQQQWLSGAVLGRQLGYWKAKLDRLPMLELPSDHLRPAIQSYRGNRVRRAVPAALVEQLTAFKRAEGATLFMIALAAFAVLLHRYSGSEDIVVGTPIAGRRRAEFEGMIGFFANTLVLRSNLAGEPTFRELLKRVRETALEAYTHQDVPFEKLVEELTPQRDPSRNPLFQVCFALQNTTDMSLALDGLGIERLELAPNTAKFDLTLTLRESGDGLSAVWEYCTDLFEHGTVERMAQHFELLLAAIVTKPEQRIGQLNLMGQDERRQILVDWNQTAADYPRDACLHTLFEAQSEHTPQAVAVMHGAGTLSYGELNARANRLARYLRAREVGPGALVAVYLEPDAELLVGLLGILKSGGAYLPLDVHLPAERLAFVLDDASATAVVTKARLLSQLPAGRGPVVCLDRDWAEIEPLEATNLALVTTPVSPAYVMYTSGSTGKPKGVCIAHRGVVNYLSWAVKAYGVASGNAIPVTSSIAFDLSVTSLFAPLLAGRAVDMPRPGDEIQAIVGSSADYSLLMLSPAHLPLLEREAGPEKAGRLARAFIVGGEQLYGESLTYWRQHAPTTRIVNEYGPTETTVACCTYELTPDSSWHGAIPIGRPIANTRLYVLDPRGQPVPIGIPGELHIAEDGVGLGYWKRPELTAERFVPDPFAAEADARMYRSGDLVRYRPDGNLEFLGRLDSQVKLRGFRIELGEIEAVIAEEPGVREVAVILREDVANDKRLAAYVVPTAETRFDAVSLLARIRTRLPVYMVPSAFVVLERLPLLSNGKVDRRALPVPSHDRSGLAGEFVPPHDEVERILCRVWAEVLGIEQVGIDDNFFNIGGHSLLAARLFSHLDKKFGRTLPLGTLFTAPTVRMLAEFYRKAAATGDSTLIPLTTGGSLPPIYAVPGAYGNVVFYADVAQSMGPDQPFYALQAVGLDGARSPLNTIEEMASFNLRQVRTVQPHGPYVFVGACFGATVAYEMAQQVLAEGEEVALLGLFDPPRRDSGEPVEQIAAPSPASQRINAMWRFVAGRVVLYRDEMRPLGFYKRLAYLARKLRRIGRSASSSFRDVEREVFQLQVYWANADAQDRYHYKPLAGSLRTLVIVQDARRASSRRTDWSKLWEGKPYYHALPGKDAGDLFKERNVPAIAAILSARLHRALSASDV